MRRVVRINHRAVASVTHELVRKSQAVLLIMALMLSGLGPLLSFPQKARAATPVTIFLTGTSASNQTWTVPADWNDSNNTIHVIGGGGGGLTSGRALSGYAGGGGGGGAYSAATNIDLTPGGTATYKLGTAAGMGATGSDNWFSNTGAIPTTASEGALAKGGAGAGSYVGGAGGAAASGVGSTKYSGGTGGTSGSVYSANNGGGGGGGAAGPHGNGANGGGQTGGSNATGGGGGGGANTGATGATGGSGNTAGAGGNGRGGTGGGGGGNPGGTGTNGGGGGGGTGGTNTTGKNAGAGGMEAIWTQTSNSATSGSGGGGGGGGGSSGTGGVGGTGGGGGLYGGGGGGAGWGNTTAGTGAAGAQGIIVITYTPLSSPAVTTGSASNITFSTATIAGSITDIGDDNATQHGIAYGTSANLSTVIATSTKGSFTGTGSFSDNITSLSPSTTYYFRAYAINSSGTGYGSIQSFTTAAHPTPAAPFLYADDGLNQIAFNGSRQNDSSPTFRVSATYNDGGSNNFNRFQIQLATTTDFSSTVYSQTFTGTYASSSVYNLTADTLSPSLPTTDDTTYYVRVRGSGDGGSSWGSWSTSNHPIWSYTYKSSGSPDWYQTTREQFNLGTLTAVSSTTGGVYLGPGAPGATTTTTLTSGSSWTVPSDWNSSNNSIEVYGGGGGGALGFDGSWMGGGGGGGYSRIDSLSLTPGASVSYSVGAGGAINGGSGGDTWFSSTGTVLAKGGRGGSSSSSSTAGPGGQASSGVGTIKYSGGNGGMYNGAGGNSGGGGGGGGAGPSGNGGGGGLGYPGVGGAGGSAGGGYAGAGGASPAAGGGSAGNNYGGAGGSGGGNAGGNGGAGAQGLVVVKYAPLTTVQQGTTTSPVIDFDSFYGGTDWSTVTVGGDVTNGSITVRVLGADQQPINGYSCTVSAGSCTINLAPLDPIGTANHASIYLQATLNYSGGSPTLQSWGVSWSSAVVPTLSTNAATNVSTSSATINGNITNTGGQTGGSTTHGFAYGTSSSLTGANVATTSLGTYAATGAFSYNLSGLTPGVTYYFRPFAENVAGTSTGSIMSFTTKTTPTLTTDSASSVSVFSGTLNANITNVGGDNATVRGFAYGTNSSLSSGVSTTSASGSFSTGTYTYDLSGLTANTTYYFRAYAVNPQGTSTGAIASFTTLADTLTVDTTAATGVTHDLATSNATIVAARSGIQHGFAYGTNSSLSGGDTATTTLGTYDGSTSFDEILSSLRHDTTYYVRAYATKSDSTAYGDIVSFRTRKNFGGGNAFGVAAAGAGIVSGGSSGGGGGESIGSEVDFMTPNGGSAVSGGGLSGGANAYASDGSYATAAASAASDFQTFNFNIPATDTITGIVVKLEASGSTAAGSFNVELSWNGGTSVTATGRATSALTTSDVVYTLGGSSDTWGRTWSPTELSNGNFRLRVTGNPSSNTVRVDAIQVRVYHQATGGGGGGGGEI